MRVISLCLWHQLSTAYNEYSANNKISITLNEPKTGWEATYIETTFNDGYVATESGLYYAR